RPFADGHRRCRSAHRRRARRRSRGRVGGVIRRVWPALVAASLLVACGGTKKVDVASDQDSLYVLPAYLPYGFFVTGGAERSATDHGAFGALVGRAQDGGRFIDVAYLLVGGTTGSDSGAGGTHVDINGAPGLQYDSALTGAIVGWQANGLTAAVSS